MATEVRCANCDSPIYPGMRFCGGCGADVSVAQGEVETDRLNAVKGWLEDADARIFESVREATAGEYDVLGELGRGGMAVVLAAHDIMLDRRVAIKVMAPNLLEGASNIERFLREARTAAALNHPNIIPVYAIKRASDGLVFFIMKFVAGMPLDGAIEETGPMPIRMVRTILAQTSDALAYAHRRGVIHRDIKPANIMIGEEGRAIVADFGIAKVDEGSTLTQSGSVVGTPSYMSPEQCQGLPLTSAADQYSLGIVAYEMLTAVRPFAGASVMEIMRQHFFDPPPPLKKARPDCPDDLVGIVDRMLAKEPEHRFGSLEDVVSALNDVPLEVNDPIRSQMVELAKSSDSVRRMRRLSTPKSPVPVNRTPPSEAPTALSRVPKYAPPRPPARRRRARARITAWVLFLGLAGGAGWAITNWDRLGVTAGGDRQRLMQPESEGLAAVPANGAAEPATSEDTAVTVNPTDTAGDELGTVAAPAPQHPPPEGAQGERNPPATRVPPGPGSITLGSRDPAAFLYIDGQLQGALSRLQSWEVPAGTVTISIRREGCQSWDSLVTVLPEVNLRIGYRNPIC